MDLQKLLEGVSCVSAADLAGHGLGTAHQLGGPLVTAPSMAANPPVQRSDDYLRDTFAEVRIIQTPYMPLVIT